MPPVSSPIIDFGRPGRAPLREYLEVVLVVAVVTFLGFAIPINYTEIDEVYLLAIVALCLRVGRGAVMLAALLSALAYSYVIIPPRFSFSMTGRDVFIVGIYLLVALLAGQLISRIRFQELTERRRVQEVTALFHLTRGLAGAHTLDEAIALSLRQADELFSSRTAVILGRSGSLAVHPASTLQLDSAALTVAEWAVTHEREAGRFTADYSSATAFYLPLMRATDVFGVFVIDLPPAADLDRAAGRGLVETFAAQIALFVERDRWRAASEQAKMLAISERLQRTLLDSVAHELKTPLSVLRSSFETSMRETSERRAVLDGEIRAAIARLDRLVANLLNQTRLEAGVIQAKLDWNDVRDIVGAARRDVGRALDDHPLKVDVPADMPLILADGPLMEQVVGNLLLNAAMHTPAGSAIGVSCGVAADAKTVFIAIEDRGLGIPPAMKASLFQKFGQGEGTSTRGIGLGLSIVKGFMLAQGGDVVVGDNPGGGSRFTVTLPHQLHEHVPNE